MDANQIIDALDTLKAADLRRIKARVDELDALYTTWQDPNYLPAPQASDGHTYRQEWTRCNKPGCSSCSQLGGHGPYWYVYWREGKKLKKKYIGKELP
jgi:hypothetical protein